MKESEAIADYLVALGDDLLVLGHRLSEWCGHAPMLEEELALANIALDCLGQASWAYRSAQTENPAVQAEDQLVYFRAPSEFKNFRLVEQPNGDFAQTIVRQLLFANYQLLFLQELSTSPAPTLAAWAQKALPEMQYHLRHAAHWIDVFGNGTAESKSRAEQALALLIPFTGEFFAPFPAELQLLTPGVVPDRLQLKQNFERNISDFCSNAGIKSVGIQSDSIPTGRTGQHTPHFEVMLNEMQSLARLHPGASW